MRPIQQMLLGTGSIHQKKLAGGKRILELDASTYSGVGKVLDLSTAGHQFTVYNAPLTTGSPSYFQFTSGSNSDPK